MKRRRVWITAALMAGLIGFFLFLGSRPRGLPAGCPPACLGAALFRFELAGSNLANANLRSANLNQSNLSRADLRNADLSGANLSAANLTNVNPNPVCRR